MDGHPEQVDLTYHPALQLAAMSRYRKSLEIREAIGDRPHLAGNYHQLGMAAQDRGDLTAAESWYRKSLEINEALGNRPGLAMTYGQLGLLAEVRGDPGGALDWTVRCVALFLEDFPHAGAAGKLAALHRQGAARTSPHFCRQQARQTEKLSNCWPIAT